MTQKLIAWNFATTAVHQRANRKFPRRYFGRTRAFTFNQCITSSALNIALCVGKAALEDTAATSSKAFALLLIVQYPSGLRK
ncbi:hypothetical protein [Olivibacter jilunii]|uniref:hypothetical protein n=1 Tax=Olivibacter jilunii TaxID=985016 RepID=UPI00059D50AC